MRSDLDRYHPTPRVSPEIPRLYLDAVDVKIRHIDVPRLRRQAAGIDARAAVMEFVASSMR
jgi:hypothetical protein